MEEELQESANVFRTDMKDAKKTDGSNLYFYNNKTVVNVGLMKEGAEPMVLYNHFTLTDIPTILKAKWDIDNFDTIIKNGHIETYLSVVFGNLDHKNKQPYINLLRTHWEPAFTIPTPFKKKHNILLHQTTQLYTNDENAHIIPNTYVKLHTTPTEKNRCQFTPTARCSNNHLA